MDTILTAQQAGEVVSVPRYQVSSIGSSPAISLHARLSLSSRFRALTSSTSPGTQRSASGDVHESCHQHVEYECEGKM